MVVPLPCTKKVSAPPDAQQEKELLLDELLLELEELLERLLLECELDELLLLMLDDERELLELDWELLLLDWELLLLLVELDGPSPQQYRKP